MNLRIRVDLLILFFFTGFLLVAHNYLLIILILLHYCSLFRLFLLTFLHLFILTYDFDFLFHVFAIGVNCTPPKFISGIIKSIKRFSIDKKIVAYPNSGEVYNAKTKTWIGISEPSSFTEMVKEWNDLGADIIGGCCRIGPKHIQGIHGLLNNFRKLNWY